MSSDLRSLIREVLAEELQAMRGGSGAHADTSPRPQVREEMVEIANDADLNRFVLRILELARDGKSVQEIRNGRWKFRLQPAGAVPATQTTAPGHAVSASSASVEFDRGLVSERQVSALPEDSLVRAGKRVRFTPLAQDELRRKRIRVERKKS